MIVEQRWKEFNTEEWEPVRSGVPFNKLDMRMYSIRINKDRQYHTHNSKGFKEAYNKAMSWMMLNEY